MHSTRFVKKILLFLQPLCSVFIMCVCARVCRKKQMLLDEKARRVTSNDSIKLFSSVGDKPENIGRAVLTYPAFASKTQVALSLSLSFSVVSQQ